MIIFGNKASRNIVKKNLIIKINKTVIPIVDSCKSLGLQLDSNLLFKNMFSKKNNICLSNFNKKLLKCYLQKNMLFEIKLSKMATKMSMRILKQRITCPKIIQKRVSFPGLCMHSIHYVHTVCTYYLTITLSK